MTSSRITLKERVDLPERLQPLWDKMLSYGPFHADRR